MMKYLVILFCFHISKAHAHYGPIPYSHHHGFASYHQPHFPPNYFAPPPYWNYPPAAIPLAAAPEAPVVNSSAPAVISEAEKTLPKVEIPAAVISEAGESPPKVEIPTAVISEAGESPPKVEIPAAPYTQSFAPSYFYRPPYWNSFGYPNSFYGHFRKRRQVAKKTLPTDDQVPLIGAVQTNYSVRNGTYNGEETAGVVTANAKAGGNVESYLLNP